MDESIEQSIHARGDDPFRDELYSAERLAETARSLALAQHWTSSELRGQTPLIGLVERAAVELTAHNALLAEAVRQQQPISPASEWLLDNHYLIDEQIRAVREDLPQDYGRELPNLTEGPLVEYPRIYEALVHMLSHTDARVDEEYLLRFIDAFQDVAPLTMGEVWAIPIVLRIALVEDVRRLARRVVEAHQAGRAADEWADRLLLTAQDRPEDLRGLIDRLDADLRHGAPAFLMRLSQRLSGQDVQADAINSWVDRRLHELTVPMDVLAHDLQHEQASDQVSIANSITSIRFLDAYEWRSFFETCSFVEQTLREDPTGVYGRMDFKSRDRYRHAVEGIARRCPHSEIEVAEAVVSWSEQALAEDPSDQVRSHPGYYLISEGRYALEQSVDYRPHGRERLFRGPLRHKGLFYWGAFASLTIALLALLGWYAAAIGAGTPEIVAILLLAMVPLSDVALAASNRVASKIFSPRILPKLDYLSPVSESHRTLVIVPALLSSVNAVRSVLDNIEVAYLANRDPNIAFGILGDLRGGATETTPGDAKIIEAATRGIHLLNERYGIEGGRQPFHALLRARRWDAEESTWMGWERKRGALVELNRYLRGATDTSFSHRIGDVAFLRTVTFVLTLDADTVLPRDGARKLVSTIAHPLNRARYAPGDARVRRGYGLVQPRVSMSLPASSRSFFAWLYSGDAGIDPYAGAVSDTYQDVFGEGSFTGKGIYEVSIFNAVLEHTFPDDTLLSHDLVEGNYLRAALASDVEVFDDHPSNYLTHVARLHRWVRGDWQTLPWLGRRVPDGRGGWQRNPLSALHRWKIADNLRRSLSAPSTVLLITLGWLLLPGPAWGWPVIMALIVLFPAYSGLIDGLLFYDRSAPLRASLPGIRRDFAQSSARVLLDLALLPFQAWLMLDAMTRALYRMTISHRGMLEWETAADADRRSGTDLRSFVRRFWPSSAISVFLLAGVVAGSSTRFLPAFVIALAWAAAPFAAWRISQVTPPVSVHLSDREVYDLHGLARRTWRFFETFVNADGNYLAPDNFQEDPKGEIAYRTSPTNMGLQLLSTLTAYDLGYLTLRGLMGRTFDTLKTMAGLDRFRGHFYNWYDTRTLQPLPPNYISTVDSGNLAGHLLVLRAGLLEASEAPVIGAQILTGLADTARLVAEDLAESGSSEATSGALRERIEEFARDMSVEEPPDDLGAWHALLARIEIIATAALTAETAEMPLSLELLRVAAAEPREMLAEIAPWSPLLAEVPRGVREDPRGQALLPLLDFVPSLVGLAEGLSEALDALTEIAADPAGAADEERRLCGDWARQMLAGILEARPQCAELLGRVRLNADMAREMWEHTDFRMLFDSQRLLFSIGYNTAEGRLDPSYYDMLASECRLASFLAIAKGDVPQEHWFRLGRVLTAADGSRALLSWSASMFEYLMPLLVMRSWPLTMLDETYTAVVRRQIQYGVERGVPWGVSESAFNAKDADLTYQYQAFGVPGLGLKRGLSEDVVVAPYATVLALPIDAHAAIENLHRLARLGARGTYGFYEALDFTPGRIPAGESRAVVRAYFAHHQGMSLLAVGNSLAHNRMRARFHGDPMVSSAELLLQERVPRMAQIATPHVSEVEHVRSIRELPAPVTRAYPLADTPVPSTHFLSNGRYSVMVTNGGGGYSRWNGLSVTRYREDVTRDCWGQFFYLRDVDSDQVWSAVYNPAPRRPDEYHVTFSADKAEYRRRDGDLETHTEIAVSPEDDVEIRRITISNHGRETRRIEVTSYFEIALTTQAGDQAHRSFSDLFVETEVVPDSHSVLFSRRQRSAEEPRFWGFHVLGCEAAQLCEWSYETDRARFLGRLNQSDDPDAVRAGGRLSCTAGAVLDPSCSIRRGAEIPPGSSARFVYATGVADSREAAGRLAEKYHDIRSGQRAIDLAWTSAQIELRDMGLTPAEAVVLQRLASRLLLTDPSSLLKVKTPVENGLPISGLWSIGISGDYPILLVRIEDLEHAPLVRQALLAHQYWRHKGLEADLVILNTRPTAYSDELDERLRLLVRTGHALQLLNKPGGVFLRRADQMHPDVLNLLLSVARATLEGDAGSIELQLNLRGAQPDDPDPFVPSREVEEYPAPAFKRPELIYDNGYGGFDPHTGEYTIVIEDGQPTPAPWINVLASPEFGCTVSEAGIGCTWAKNSHENRITTWNNDPVSDGSGEVIYLRDEETGEFWSPTPLPIRESEPYVVRHGKGYTTFEHTSHGIEQKLEWLVPVSDPVRIVRVTLSNLTDRPRTISVTQFVEWTLGSSRSQAQHLVVTWYDAETDTLTAHNHFNMDFPGRAAFLACDAPLHSYTASRTEFVGRNRRPANPAAMHRQGLGSLTGRFRDNCGALMTSVELEPRGSRQVTFLLGQTDTLEEARAVVAAYRSPLAVDRALAGVRAQWDNLLGTVRVTTPDPALDLMINGQLLYQALACRLWGRTATYQSSGAFGFRDQLQDVLALIYARPELVREQIVEASRHQFEAGDVLHWWQPHSGRGVRTRITDDRHWLPFVVCEYVSATGDESVLDESTPYIEGPPVEPEREDNYLQPGVSERSVSVYEHCVAALESARGTGSHDLPLMGGGDWNDGMNRVGIEGRGESVWLAWFLDVVLRRFADIAERRNDLEHAEEFRSRASSFVRAAEEHGWDGSWYRRAFFDDGSPLGSRVSEECRIDAIAQAWATISGSADPERAASALEAVEEQLVSHEDGLIRLLTPPFDKTERDPGYIKGYVPGVRENGGQYTHAALWVALAYLLSGDGNEAHGLLDLINPVNHARSRDDADLYKVEPYVVAADVYAVEPHVGRGGWTWYTGSASWFYRVVVQNHLGLGLASRDGQRYLRIDPCIPKGWKGFEMTYRFGMTRYRISVENPRGVNRGVAYVELDGRRMADEFVPLADDGADHDVLVRMLGG